MLERVLVALSYDPTTIEAHAAAFDTAPSPTDDPLERLRRIFPETRDVVGKTVLDFGCGYGLQAVAFAKAGAHVIGLDINEGFLASGRRLAEREGVSVMFTSQLPLTECDIVVCQDSMEHFRDPAGALDAMRRLLGPKGIACITFGPPWLHPFGGHQRWITPVPWSHLIFPESVQMRVRSRFRDDGARHFGEIEGGLNKMTLAKFHRLVRDGKMRIQRINYRAISDLPVVSKLPIIREFLTARVDAVLRNPGAP